MSRFEHFRELTGFIVGAMIGAAIYFSIGYAIVKTVQP